jgi:hypothetical protein
VRAVKISARLTERASSGPPKRGAARV